MSRPLAVLVLLLAACGSSSKEEKASDAPRLPAPLASELPKGKLWITSRESDFMDMLDELEQADVVYLGADHGNADHHLLQLRIIEHLVHRRRLHAIGVDYFDRSFQPALKRYVEGEMDESELVRTEVKLGPYRAILAHARANRLPVRALALENDLRLRVLEGGLDAVPEAVRMKLPAVDVALFPEHRAERRAAWDKSEREFVRAYLVHCLEEEVIADGIVNWFRTAPDDSQIVVLAGIERVLKGHAVPERAHRRNGRSYKTVIPLSGVADGVDRSRLAHTYADFVWFVPPPVKAAD
jgi:uncharacterized iron-regulated protein